MLHQSIETILPLLPMLQQHARRLREADFYGNEPLREVVERMLPEEKQA